MVAASPLPSDEDLLRQLHALPDHLKGEIIEGELFVQPRPRFRHARAVLRSARPFKGAHMRFPFALAFGVLAASCAAPPESSTPMLSEGGEAREDSTPAERTGEAQDPWTRAQCQEAFVENLHKCDSWADHKEVCHGMCAALLVACIALTKE